MNLPGVAIVRNLCGQQAMHEIINGPLSLDDAKKVADEGGLCFDLDVATDAKSMLSALNCRNLKKTIETLKRRRKS